MSSNILQALHRLSLNPISDINAIYAGNNRINNVGVGLEHYIQDLFADTIHENKKSIRHSKINDTFSYLGNQNNPPDLIIKSGDALEIKKIQSKSPKISLNSSYPKNKLYKTDPRITVHCKNCEDWDEKDIIYCIGQIANRNVQFIWFVYGNCYAAEASVYQSVSDAISKGISVLPNLESSTTKELGRVNNIDPLGITDLRVRGLWHIEHPIIVFDYVYEQLNNPQRFVCLMTKDKYHSFSKLDRNTLKTNKLIQIMSVDIRNPNNPAKMIESIAISL